jgi:hypothetical protein
MCGGLKEGGGDRIELKRREGQWIGKRRGD